MLNKEQLREIRTALGTDEFHDYGKLYGWIVQLLETVKELSKEVDTWKRHYQNLQQAYTDEPKGFEKLKQYFEGHEILKPLWEEVSRKLVEDQCFSFVTYFIFTIEKLLEEQTNLLETVRARDAEIADNESMIDALKIDLGTANEEWEACAERSLKRKEENAELKKELAAFKALAEQKDVEIERLKQDKVKHPLTRAFEALARFNSKED